MKLSLQFQETNTFPLHAILIKGTEVMLWLKALDAMEISFHNVHVFPVPSKKANELYGCLVVGEKLQINKNVLGKNQLLQCINNQIFIPEYTSLTPSLSNSEFNKSFGQKKYLFHPEIGFYELEEKVNWTSILQLDFAKNEINVEQPSKSVFIPQNIHSAKIEFAEKDILKKIQNEIDAIDSDLPNPFDVQKLKEGNSQEVSKLLEAIKLNPELALKYAIPLDTIGSMRGNSLGSYSFGTSGRSNYDSRTSYGNYGDNQSYKEISRGRSTSSDSSDDFFSGNTWFYIGKFIFVFFVLTKGLSASGSGLGGFFAFILFIGAIALIIKFIVNSTNSSNSYNDSSYDFQNSHFEPLNVQKRNESEGVWLDSEKFKALQKKYEELAEEFIEKGEYLKACHIYFKLLGNNLKAAETLEKGELYNEAATYYLKLYNYKIDAARCYELGHSYSKAIDLYLEMGQLEKAADLYMVINEKEKAEEKYNLVIDQYKSYGKYIEASHILKNKLHDFVKAQEVLLHGWRHGKNRKTFLNEYLNNYDSEEELMQAIHHLKDREVDYSNSDRFLDVLKDFYAQKEQLQQPIRTMAYQIIADRVDTHPSIVSLLKSFNSTNKLIDNDIQKYTIQMKKKKN